jgi:hypothetical protein
MPRDNPFSRPEPDSGTHTSDRRRAGREAAASPIQVSIETVELRGVVNNISKAGALFFTEGDLRVTVEVLHDGETQRLTGSLVRCERIKGDHRGWAVEFDHD